MTYQEAARYVEGLAILGMRFGLERMRRLLAALGEPQRVAPAIHVVGTNGKSSTTRIAAAALRSQGLLAGAYLSPHISDWRERIEVDGRPVARAEFAAAIERVREAVEGLRLAPDDAVTQFEVLTAAGFVAFARAGVEAMVVEAGLGGRHDASNVLAPDAVVALTNVALEHTELLGNTEAEIAAEKLAVAVDGSDRLVVGRLAPRAREAVAAAMAARGLDGWLVGRDVLVEPRDAAVDLLTPLGAYRALPLALNGGFQRDNLAVALAACERRLGRTLEGTPLRRALRAVRMPGRLEVLPGEPVVVLDGAHNPAGMEALVESLPGLVGRRRPVAVLSVLDDKDAAAMVASLARHARAVVATRSTHPRAAAPETLVHLARIAGLDALAVEPPEAAVMAARRLAGARGAVVICGSLYLLADLRSHLVGAAAGPPDMLAPKISRESR
ncbi:MAG TPA: cyanophycin synthetase [Miltoncostaeaceae bacterium]|nr:cyanophycin synthetase [Miltoncostaeaceae bacterium]